MTQLVQVHLVLEPQNPYKNFVMMHLEFHLGGGDMMPRTCQIYSSQISEFQVQ